ncbi:peptidoglycan DD-metalloendopeptidase family protein [uncultured Methylobacterium sp.]|uniref:peptidoglycan DD-metalloendopeptidase family protein n=1 Tax=uncultured Methylobacterium sp. TaxID=157278 RepID=UPI0035CA21E1
MKTLSRFALIGVIGGGAAACSSDASRLDSPFTNPFASNLASEPSATGSLPDMPASAPIRTGRIQSESLGAPIAPRPGPMAARPPTQPMAQTTRVASTGAAGWNAQGGTTITVSRNDSLNQMSARFGVPASAILSANGLTSASQVTPGRQIVIPVYNASGMNPAAAPMTARTVPAAPSERVKAAETKHQDEAKAEAKRKEAAKEAAKEDAKEAAKEAEAKKLADRRAEEKARKEAALKEADAKKRHLRPGQVAKAETKPQAKVDAKVDAKADRKADAARRAEAEARLAKADAAKEAAKKVAEAKAAKAASEKVAAAKPEPVKVAVAEKPEPASTGSVAPDQTFRWPAKGRVISGYGSSGNEGINIAVPEGTAVKAAEDGTVAYAGSDVKGYGKLVLVRHSNGYVSAYAHNGELDVKPGEKVKRGQTIAKSGASGNVTSPQLHFEIRKSGAPIDPMSQLASN